jgi:hypothetical protein
MFTNANAGSTCGPGTTRQPCSYSDLCIHVLEFLTVIGNFSTAMGARNQVGIGLLYRPARARICRSFKETRYRFPAWRAGTKPYLSYWPARLNRLAKSIPRNRFLGSINVYKYELSICSLATQFQTRFLESIPSTIAGLKFSTLSMGPRNRVGTGLSYWPAWDGNLSPAMGARNQVA